jgi:hypothetical protein
MSVYKETRSSVARWSSILIATYAELVRLGAGDVWVYGSQAMSLHMTRPLASKDLDLLVSGMKMGIVRELCKFLAPFSSEREPYFNFQSPVHEGKQNPVFSVYLGGPNEKPFAIELFQTYNGHELKELAPYAVHMNRWKTEFQTLSIEAIIATRLSFRPPDRISSFNAQRLNRFIRATRDKVDWSIVSEFAKRFQLERRIIENLIVLRQHGIEIIDASKLSLSSENF